MSQESIEALVRSGRDAFNRGDLDAFIDVWDEECEYQPAWELDMAGEDSFRGHEGIRRWWQEMSDAWSDWETSTIRRWRSATTLVFAESEKLRNWISRRRISLQPKYCPTT
jgi:ketosteroid isomerase-like protein